MFHGNNLFIYSNTINSLFPITTLHISYLFIFSIDVHFLGADGLADVLDVIFSAVIKDVLILFPESDTEIENKERERERNKGPKSASFTYREIIVV